MAGSIKSASESRCPVADKPDVDLERARVFIKAQNFQEDADGDFLEDFEQELAAEFRAVRLRAHQDCCANSGGCQFCQRELDNERGPRI